MFDKNGLLILLFIFALALGWFLARFPPTVLWMRFTRRAWRQSYLRGLQFLLDDQADHSIESLVSSWEVNHDNFDLHNALANMLRRKGEVDRAIAIHTNLLSVSESAGFSPQQLRLATTELARDFIKSGLLDRAERLLINVVNNSKETEESALQLLLSIYQQESEWHKAILVAQQLHPHDRVALNDKTLMIGKLAKNIAHFYCEMASFSLKQDDFIQAEKNIASALAQNPSCARASLLEAELYFERSNEAKALEVLSRLPQQDAQLLVEALPLLEAYLQHKPSLYLDLLQRWQLEYPSADLEIAIFEVMLGMDDDNAITLLEQALRRRPTLRGLHYFIGEQEKLERLKEQGLTDISRKNIELVARLVKDVLKDKPDYQCKSCGFAGNQLHWQCPQCHQWDTIRRIRGPEGD